MPSVLGRRILLLAFLIGSDHETRGDGMGAQELMDGLWVMGCGCRVVGWKLFLVLQAWATSSHTAGSVIRLDGVYH